MRQNSLRYLCNARSCFGIVFFKSKLTTLLVTALFLLGSIPVATAGGVVGNGNPVTCTEAALNTALLGGGSVTFNCGSLPKTIVFGSEKTIAADTIIDGGNRIILSGANATRLFAVKPNVHFTVSNLTFANGFSTEQGGAIHAGMYQNTVLNVNHCTFLNNVSTMIGGKGGGAIFSSAGAVNVDNSTFSGNKAGQGGAIRIVQSNLTVTASTFTANKGIDPLLGDGGAIHVDGAKTDNGKVIIRTSKFNGNSATNFGGAVFNNILNNNTTAIMDSVFVGNSVGVGGKNGQGGAIWSTGDPKFGGQWINNTNNTTLTIVNTVIEGNSATKIGGGLFVARHLKGTVISRSTFANNTALTSMGGGIAQADNGKLSILNSTISNNESKGPNSMGAGIYVGRNASAIMTNITVANNTANWQAGGIFGGMNVTLKNSILANNIALNGGNAWNIKHNCNEAMFDGGGNLQYPNPTDQPCAAGILLADPKLAPLANNGGFTKTRALLSGSAASQLAASCPVTDQRGVTRAQPVGTDCDSGAFEANF